MANNLIDKMEEVFYKAFECADTTILHFGTYSFSFFQVGCAMFAIGICATFIRGVFFDE